MTDIITNYHAQWRVKTQFVLSQILIHMLNKSNHIHANCFMLHILSYFIIIKQQYGFVCFVFNAI